ncbi:NYN domain-containing protein [Aspergillus tanneri]|uniref:NYN domain-containing protein n=1 Tax=Aspergillus tanneri TaxID=1220188 RepID=A0A5M9MRK4_9EURO|nr:uncharacterized protein ATNIH1004_002199 [Aspergillus tanneri]KAA8649528.1 hypothetical protein ATNIH1004_002199 [Aspergillus tanneri]
MVGDNIPKLAVLIDAENARSSVGDWTKPHLQDWKGELLERSIQPIQQFAYTHGKNATDSAMIIDAMDLLYSGFTDVQCEPPPSSGPDNNDILARIQRLEDLILRSHGVVDRSPVEPTSQSSAAPSYMPEGEGDSKFLEEVCSREPSVISDLSNGVSFHILSIQQALYGDPNSGESPGNNSRVIKAWLPPKSEAS